MDVFHRPGECDLTTNVDFAYLKEAIGDLGTVYCCLSSVCMLIAFSVLATIHGPIPQATFLERMGIQVRVESLKKAAKDDQRKADIAQAASRLVDKLGMGTRYLFLAVTGTRHPEQTQEQKWSLL